MGEPSDPIYNFKRIWLLIVSKALEKYKKIPHVIF